MPKSYLIKQNNGKSLSPRNFIEASMNDSRIPLEAIHEMHLDISDCLITKANQCQRYISTSVY
jgi:hypothetical protein